MINIKHSLCFQQTLGGEHCNSYMFSRDGLQLFLWKAGHGRFLCIFLPMEKRKKGIAIEIFCFRHFYYMRESHLRFLYFKTENSTINRNLKARISQLFLLHPNCTVLATMTYGISFNSVNSVLSALAPQEIKEKFKHCSTHFCHIYFSACEPTSRNDRKCQSRIQS